MRFFKFILNCLLCFIISVYAPAQTCTTSWNGLGDGTSWGDPDNWDNGVPGPDDDVCITLSGTYTVTVGNFTVNSLRLGGASGTQTLQTAPNTASFMNIATTAVIGVHGVMEWNSAVLESGTLINQGLVRLESGYDAVRGASTVFRNEGTVIQTSIEFNISGYGRVENASVWDMQSDVSFTGAGSGLGGVFVNEAGAIFKKTAGSGTTYFANYGESFDNFGTISVQSGKLDFGWSTTQHNAVLTTSEGTTLEFSHEPVNPSTIFIGNNSGHQEGLLLIKHPISAGADAVWNFTGNGISWQHTLTSGKLTNQGLIRILMTATTVEGSAIFRNEGRVEHVNGRFIIQDSGRVENAAVWDIQADYILYAGGGPMGVFVNEAGALFLRSAGIGQVRFIGFDYSFDNFGTIDVQTGEISIEIPSTHSDATLTTSESATLRFKTGVPPITFIGSITGTQEGNLVIEQDFIAGANAIWAFDGNELTWNSGLLVEGTLTSQTPIRIRSSATKGANGAATLFRSEAPIVHEEGTFEISGGARVENISLWDVQGDPDYLGAGGIGTFVNKSGAVFKKSTGIGTTVFSDGDLLFDNEGTVSVENGEIDIEGPFDHMSGALIQGTGVFDVIGSSFTHSGDTGPGLSPGILTWQGGYTMSTAATLNIEIMDNSGDGTGHDVLAVNGDVDVTQGTLNVTNIPGTCPDTPPCDYTFLTFSGLFTGPFAQENLPPNARVIYPNDQGGIPGEVLIRIGEALAVELISFNAEINDKTVHLYWETASENNNAGFYVERKSITNFQASEWVEIGWVKGQGSAAENQHYEFTDSSIPYGVAVTQYRLRQIDYDDKFQFSPIIVVELPNPSSIQLHENFPNPFDTETVIHFSLPGITNVRLSVYDLFGSEIVRLVESRLPGGQHKAKFQADGLPSGMYFYTLDAGGFKETRRMLLIR